MTAATLSSGFTDLPLQAQSAFRLVLNAMARPGRIETLADDAPAAPAPLDDATFALALTLLDFETPTWLDAKLAMLDIVESLRFHCGCPIVDPELAALAIKQARGDLVEAAFLLRAYRTTLPRFGYTTPIDTAVMTVKRRISATYKDLPGGQLLGPTFDYSHRLLDFKLAAEGAEPEPAAQAELGEEPMPRVVDILLSSR